MKRKSKCLPLLALAIFLILFACGRSGGSGNSSSTPPASKIPASIPSSSSVKPVYSLFKKVWEPNEHAFSFMMPKDWKMAGGVFNVDPARLPGPVNILSPKVDFTVKKDDQGTVMIRWFPTWYYADLTYTDPMTRQAFRPGQNYRGMIVKPIPSAKQFLMELFKTNRPRATDEHIVAEDTMPEVVEAYNRQYRAGNIGLRNMGKPLYRFDALGMVVEYKEQGQRFREALMTVIVDSRGGAFMWSNENTLAFRAPLNDFDVWKPVIDMIRNSGKPNEQWLAAVNRERAKRIKNDRSTQDYVNKTLSEIVEHRRQTYAEIRHEQWLFISGKEEYKDPWTGRVERDISTNCSYRWKNRQGDILCTEQGSLDPNTIEEYNSTREWKRTEVWDRKG